ncbi:MAG: tetratricopeptide repeat protein [Thermoplasmata archaeon]|nr:tetratricopeptide repeat protein [Thermoplasmata archaeon]
MAEPSIPIIGREEELSRLRALLDEALGGEGQTAFIAGEPGVGKTTLINRVYEWATDARAITVFGKSNSGESSEPYSPFRKALASLGDVEALSLEDHTSFGELYLISRTGLLINHQSTSDDDGVDEDILSSMLTAVQDFVKDSFGDGEVQITGGGLGKLEYRNKKVLLEHGNYVFLAGVVSGNEHPRMRGDLKKLLCKVEEEFGEIISDWDGDLDSVAGTHDILKLLIENQYPVRKTLESMNIEAERLKAQMNILEVLGSKADKGLVVVLEDIHWADETTLQAIPYLVRNMKDSRVLFLCTYEPDDIPTALSDILSDMGKEGTIEEMEIEPLSLADTSRLIQSMLSADDLPEGLVDRVHADNGGNPFFTMEMIRSMLATGILYQRDDIWIFLSEKADLIPSSASEIVSGQLGSMSMEVIHLLEFASILGTTFYEQEISIGMEMDVQRVRQVLEDLCQTDMIFLSEDGIYNFRHAMVQEAISSGLSERWNGILHKAAGNSLEFIYEYDIDSALFRLAHHFARSSEYEKGISYSIEAGEKAANNHALREATRFYEAAIGLIDRSGIEKGKVLDLNITLAELFELNGMYDEAIIASERAAKVCTECGLSATIDKRLGFIHFARGEYDLSIQSFERAIEQAKQADDELLLAGCYGGLGKVYLRKGEYEKSLELQENYLEVSQRMEAQKDIGLAYLNLGGVHWHMSEFEKTVDTWNLSLENMTLAGYELGMAYALNNLGAVNEKLGNLDEALDHYSQCIEIKNKLGDIRGGAMSYNNIGIIQDLKGEFKLAIQYYKKSLEIRHKIGDVNGIANAYNNLGTSYLFLKEFDESLDHYRRYLEIVRSIEDTWGIAQAYNNMSEPEMYLGMMEESLEHSRKAIEMATEHGFKEILASSYRKHGWVLAKLGDLDNAIEFLEKGIVIAEETKEAIKLGEGYLTMGKVLGDSGDKDKSREYLEMALDIFKKGKMISQIKETEELLTKLA